MAEIKDYDVDANNNTATPPDGAAEGWAPSTVNNTIRELMARTKRLWEDTSAVKTTTGTSNAYLLSASQTISAYAAGDVFMFVADRANTGAATLAVDGLAAKSLKTVTQAELVAGQLTANGIYVAAYDTTNDVFQVLGVDESTGTMTLDSLSVDTISEKTSAAGVTIDGVLLKDNAVSATAASTVTVTDASNEAVTITQTGNGGGVLIADSGTGTALHVTNATAQAAIDPVLVVGDSGGSVQAANFADGILVDSQRYGLTLKRHNDTDSAVGVINVRSRGTSGAETAVDDDDNLGTFSAMGHHGSGYITAGYLAFRVDETQRSLSGTNIPSEFLLVLNDGTTYNTPLQILPSSTAGYAHTTINGSATLNGQTGASGLTINSNGDAYAAVSAIANNDTCTAQLANNTYTFSGSGGVLAQAGPSNNAASVFNSESASHPALVAYAQNDTTITQIAHANTYTLYGAGGILESRGATSDSTASAVAFYNSSGGLCLTIRNDGQFRTGSLSYSPYNQSLTSTRKQLYVDLNGYLGYDGSSERIKENIVDMDAEWADKILDFRPVNYQLVGRTNSDWTEYGLIAEEVGAIDPRYVYWDTGERAAVEEARDGNGKVVRAAQPAKPRKPQSEWIADGIEYQRLVPGLINIAQRQRDRIEALETQVSDLTAQLSALADRVAALEA